MVSTDAHEPNVEPEALSSQETSPDQLEQVEAIADAEAEEKGDSEVNKEEEPSADHHVGTASGDDSLALVQGQETDSSHGITDETWESKWIKAIETEDLEKVQGILDQNRIVDLRFDYQFPDTGNETIGLTPLLLSAALGKAQIVEYLIRKEANVQACTTSNNSTALHLVTKRGHTKIAEALLKAEIPIDARTGYGDTALMLAVYYEKEAMVTTLLKWYILLNKPINTTNEDGWTALLYAGDTGNAVILEALLNHDTDIKEINRKDLRNRTALHLACRQGDVDCVKLLLSQHADIKMKDTSDRSPLHMAAFYENLSVIEELLQWTTAEDWNMVQSDGCTPLHIAAVEENREIFDVLLSDGKTDITIRDKQRRTVLAIVAQIPWHDAVLPLIEKKSYFPDSPTETNAVLATETEASDVEDSLMKLLAEWLSPEVEQNLEATMYWAVLNGRSELADACTDKGQDIVSWRRGEASWLHVAAIKGEKDMVERLLLRGVDINIRGKGGVTALHMVARFGHDDALKALLKQLWWAPGRTTAYPGHRNPLADDVDQVRSYPFDTFKTLGIQTAHMILTKTEAEESALSLAIQGRSSDHREVEKTLWNTLKVFSHYFTDFLDSQGEGGTHLLEMAAKSERRGQKSFLMRLLSSKEGPEEIDSKDWTTLHWAVYHGFPVVVWWLLANGGHLSGEEKSRGSMIASKRKDDKQIEKSRKQHYEWIMSLLHNPPAILENEALLDEDNSPELLNLDIDDKIQGTIVDFYKKGLEVDLQIHQSPVREILYGAGPQAIMSTVAKKDIRQLKNLRELMKEEHSSSADAKVAEKVKKATDQKQERKKDPSDKSSSDVSAMSPGNFQFRWLHIPVNDMDCVQELMTKIALDQGRKVKDHRPLANFVRRSWTELVAGGRKKYMKPQCVHRESTSQPSINTAYHERNSAYENSAEVFDQSNNNMTVAREDNPDRSLREVKKTISIALYMPYLSWGKKPMLKNAESHGHRESNTGGHWEDIGEEETDYGTLLTALLGSSTHHTAQTDEHARVLHKPMTLDQYYYASLDDTSKRDETQVVFRYFFREKKKEEEEAMREAEKAKDKEKKTGGVRRNNTDLHKRNGELIAELEIQSRNLLYGHKHASESNSSQNDDTDDQILMVDQLWLWITDDKTIITSTTKQTKQYDDAVLQNIVSYLVDSSSKGLSRPESVEMLMRLAIGTATEFLRDNKIKVAGNKTKTPMEIFQESIRYVSSRETALFETFEGYLRNDQKGVGRIRSSRQKSPKGSQETNPYYDIREEMNLLREIKDICDELNILKNLYEDQELVWKQAFKMPLGDQEGLASEVYPPTELRWELEELIAEAVEVQRAINTLLDLKQQQSNIAEAKYSGMQSEQSARQTDTIMSFTIVTIVFTPMSFLTSLFALNVSEYPHQSGSVVYNGWWIFPIIFGVSSVVAAVFIGFAFNASRIRDLLERRRQYRELRDNHHSQTSTSSVSFNNQPQRRRGTLVARIAERCKSRWEHLAGRIKKQHEDAHDIEKQPVVGVKNPQHATQITAKGTVVETKSSSRSSTNRNEP